MLMQQFQGTISPGQNKLTLLPEETPPPPMTAPHLPSLTPGKATSPVQSTPQTQTRLHEHKHTEPMHRQLERNGGVQDRIASLYSSKGYANVENASAVLLPV